MRGKNDMFRMDSIDIPNSDQIWIGEFYEGLSETFNERVMESFARCPIKPIVIFINSPGGLTSEMLSMMDTMDRVRAQAPEEFYFITYASGMAKSAGADLLAHGDMRIATPKTRVMLHQSRGELGGSFPDAEIQFNDWNAENEMMFDILLANTKLKGGMKALKKLLDRDACMSPEEAKKYGIIDEVGYLCYRERAYYEVGVKATERKLKGNTLRKNIFSKED